MTRGPVIRPFFGELWKNHGNFICCDAVMEACTQELPQMWSADWKNTAAEKVQNTPAAEDLWNLSMQRIVLTNLLR